MSLAVTYDMPKMKIKCAEYTAPRFVRKETHRRYSASVYLMREKFGEVLPSGRIVLTKGD